ncbi:MAG: UDP-N-acetylmuramate dehydrogenase [Alphaproteobacteria bacterium]|nr:UDP-N-acetylmuramate dehydrogenase [Alphaproteobacteria bacterium]
MMAAPRTDHLIDRLPKARGRLIADAPLHRYAWFRVGGAAEVLFEPADRDDLAAMLRSVPPGVPITVIGAASNLLIRDGGVAGLVIRLTRGFATISVDGDTVVAGAGAMDINVARQAAAAGLGGLEFLSGVPGSVGGALRMNAGAYGREIADVLIDAEAIGRDGNVTKTTAADMGFSYRHTTVAEDLIFVSARFRGAADDPRKIAARMAEIRAAREDSQPIRSRTGGSTFKNPPRQKAWQLIDRAGCRGLVRGGARVSEQHCNFLINTGSATAADLEGLGEEIRRRVKAATGVVLEWEIRRIGDAPAHGLREVGDE